MQGDPIILINAGTGREITTSQTQKRSYQCDAIEKGYIHGVFWNFGNADNVVRISCKEMAFRPFEFPYFHGGAGASTLYPLTKDEHVGYVLSGSTITDYQPFLLEVPKVSAPFWIWKIEVSGTDATVNALLEFYPEYR